MANIQILALGQVGYQFQYKNLKWLIDPYLSDYVEKCHGIALKRQIATPVEPSTIQDVDFILITHEHEDHCDPITIEQILRSNPECVIFCTKQCNDILAHLKADIRNLRLGEEVTFEAVRIKALPASHTSLEISEDGFSRWMGYLFLIKDYRIYHAGDTIPFESIIKYFSEQIDLAFLPINERNYFRNEQGIIGNMTPREALGWVKLLKIKNWIPTHWDMFEGNSTLKIELDAIADTLGLRKHRWLDAGKSIEINLHHQ